MRALQLAGEELQADTGGTQLLGELATRGTVVVLGMPEIRSATGRCSRDTT